MNIDVACYCGARFQLDTATDDRLANLCRETYEVWQKAHTKCIPDGQPEPWKPVEKEENESNAGNPCNCEEGPDARSGDFSQTCFRCGGYWY